MFTKWQQIEEWITDNGFQRWIFFKNNPETRDADRANDKVLDSKFYPGNIDDKLALTKKHLEQWGSKAYGWAYKTENATVGACVCEVRLDAVPDMPAQQPVQQQMVASLPVQQIDEDKMRASIKKELEAEFAQKEFEKEKQALEKEKREFDKVKNSAIGILVQQFAPYVDTIAGILKQKRMVAGVDAEQPVTAPPIQTLTPETDGEEESPFSDEEADALFALLARFKKVEPDYLQLIEAVVSMAESGDNTYTMAKGFLLKKQ